MGANVSPTRAVVTPKTLIDNKNQTGLRVVLFNQDGTAAGTVTKAAAQANSTATDVPGLVADFNALLAKLRTAGVIAT